MTFDCITCDKCIPVCPNDANFSYRTGELRLTYRDVEVRPDGSVVPIGDEKLFELKQAYFADYCNHCGNCDTFCPEYDGPYLKKPNFYGSRQAFDAGAPHDGFFLEGASNGATILTGRIAGRRYHLQQLINGGGYQYHDGKVVVRVSKDGSFSTEPSAAQPQTTHQLDVGRFHALATLLRGITDPTRVHAVNTPLLAMSSEA